MPDSQNIHPDLEALRNYALGKLIGSESVQRMFEEHLLHCEQCADYVISQPASPEVDSLINHLRTDPDQTFITGAELLPDSTSFHAPAVQILPQDEIPALLKNHHRYKNPVRIGAGGMGDVFKVKDARFDRHLAIKLATREKNKDMQEAYKRLKREIEVTVKLNHQNIAWGHDYEEKNGMIFIIKEFVEGETLDKILSKQTPLSIETVCYYASQVAAGLEAANKYEIVHRDIKPANLIVTKDGVVKILDYGLAYLPKGRHTNEKLTNNYTVVGSLDYMSPEQTSPDEVPDIRSDIYSLGCTFYEMLTNKAPFFAVMNKFDPKTEAHKKLTPPPIEQLRPEASQELVHIVAKMMAKKPDDRYQHPAEVIAALRPFITPDVTINANMISADSYNPEVKRGGKWMLVVGAALFIMVIVIVFLIAQLLGKAPSYSQQALSSTIIQEPTQPLPEPDTALAVLIKETACLRGHEGQVNSVAFSPNGMLALSGGIDATIRLWDLEKRKELHQFIGIKDGIRRVTFMHDGKKALATGGTKIGTNIKGTDFSLLLFDVSTGKLEKRLKANSNTEQQTQPVWGLAIHPKKAQALSAGGDSAVRMWNVVTASEALKFETVPVVWYSIAYSPDGELAAGGGSDNQVWIWNVETGRIVKKLSGHVQHVTSVVFTADSKRLISGSADKTVRLWDVASGNYLHTIGVHTDGLWCIAISKDGTCILTGCARHWTNDRLRQIHANDFSIKLWDIQSNRLLARLEGHDSDIVDVCFSPDDHWALSASADGTIRYWQLPLPK